GPRAAAIPPWAHLVDPSSSKDLVTSSTLRPGSALRAARAVVTPATPEPTTTTSARLTQPGSGASSRRAAVLARGDDPPRPLAMMVRSSGVISASDGQCHVVDQPGAAYLGGDKQQGRTRIVRADLAERPRIDQRQVVDDQRRIGRGRLGENNPG